MNKIFYLSTCDTCLRIMKEIDVDDTWEKTDIKKTNIDAKTLDEIYVQTGSYEDIFSKRARKFKNIKDSITCDNDYRKLILAEYTFLKRPVILIDDTYYIGNSKKTIAAILEKLQQ